MAKGTKRGRIEAFVISEDDPKPIRLYSAILRGEKNIKEYQLLCANCNWIKRFEKKEHNGVTKNGR